MKNNIAFVVLSCDNYSDLWPIFIKQFEENWPDCPYDKFISTNFLSAESESFKDIKIGKDNSWSDGVLKTLYTLKDKYEYALITLEDLILIEKVNTQNFKHIFSEFIKTNGNYLKFTARPKPTNKYNSVFGEIKPGSLYRPTCVYTLWKIETLIELLIEEENAWEFERFGSVRSDNYSGFYVVYKDFFNVLNTVVQGKWVPKEKKIIKSLGNSIDNDRETLSFFKSVKLKINLFYFKLFSNIIPWQYQRKIIFNIKGYARKYNNPNI